MINTYKHAIIFPPSGFRGKVKRMTVKLIRANEATLRCTTAFPVLFLAYNPAAIVVVNPTVLFIRHHQAVQYYTPHLPIWGCYIAPSGDQEELRSFKQWNHTLVLHYIDHSKDLATSPALLDKRQIIYCEGHCAPRLLNK